MTVGRNDPCPCGSGKKFKKCCEGQVPVLSPALQYQDILLQLAKTAYNAKDYPKTYHHCRELLGLNPDHPEGLHLLGWLYMLQGQFEEAEAVFSHLTRAVPGDVRFLDSFARVLGYRNKLSHALDAIDVAIRLAPTFLVLHITRGKLCTLCQKHKEAAHSYETATKLQPDNLDAYVGLYHALYAMGDDEKASVIREKILQFPALNRSAFEVHTLLDMPKILPSKETITHLRKHMHDTIDRLLETKIQLPWQEDAVKNTPFLLAFHNEPNKALFKKLASLYLHVFPDLHFTAPHCRGYTRKTAQPLRLGIVSRHLYRHVVSDCFSGIIAGIAQENDTEVMLFTSHGTHDEKLVQLTKAVKAHVVLPVDLRAAQELIAGYQLDILLYTDVGMDHFTYFLAFSRLAPIQCCFAGHPVTTGIPTMDYFISSPGMEPEHAEEHYSEKLVLVPHITTLYPAPSVPPCTLGRADFSLPEQGTMYYCPLKLQKFHPAFDEALGAILAGDPEAFLVLVEDNHDAYMGMHLRERFSKTLPDVCRRIYFLPFMTQDRFMQSVQVADVVLDTFYFGAGTTAYLTLAVGTPMVTLEGTMLAGRCAAQFYRVMGFTELTALTQEEYVALALKLGSDAKYRSTCKEQIVKNCHKLYDDPAIIKEVSTLLKELPVPHQ